MCDEICEMCDGGCGVDPGFCRSGKRHGDHPGILGLPTWNDRNDAYPSGGRFTANASGTVVINQMGYVDAGNDGLLASHEVGLYMWNGTTYAMQASATVPSGTTAELRNGFRWVDITPFTLSNTASNAYLLVANTAGGDHWGCSPNNAVTGNPAIGVTKDPPGANLWSNPAASLPSTLSGNFGGGAQIYVAGNIASKVPEPSTVVLLGIGAISLLAYAWRRRK